MALGQPEGDRAGGDNSAGGRRSATAADRKHLLILNASASTPNTAQRASHADQIYKTSPVAARPHSQVASGPQFRTMAFTPLILPPENFRPRPLTLDLRP